jgi:SAM domain (Sterile alpha motif)
MNNPKLEWILRKTGLESWRRRFEREGIDDRVIGEIREDELKEMGMGIGDRKRIMEAIWNSKDLVWVKPTPPARSDMSSDVVPSLCSVFSWCLCLGAIY